MNSKLVLTYTALMYGIFGGGWFLVPNVMGKIWAIAPGENFTYVSHRYGAILLGLALAIWLVRGTPNTQTRRGLMIGAFVGTVLTAALSAYASLALGLNGWPAFATEAPPLVGFVWVLFIKPEPVV